jgi:glyoxylase-like metal-dependent hydrolase (beta-lactamase superfamily II)
MNAPHGEATPVAPDVAMLTTGIVNLYFVGTPGTPRGWTLVDAGLGPCAGRLQRAAEDYFGLGARPDAIVLTHAHFDHVGALRDLAELWDVPIYAHHQEMPYLTGRAKYPPPDPSVEGGAMARLSFLYPRGAPNVSNRVRELPSDGLVPTMDGWKWLHTPGHTPGHVSLWRESDGVLLAGDAFVTVKQESLVAVLEQKPEVRRPPAYFTINWEQARASVMKLASLRPETVATGHGKPMSGAVMRAQLERLARDFDLLGTPSHGVYVTHPAISDESGVVTDAPAISNLVPRVATAAALGAAVALLVRRRL